ncbi:MAG: sensor histidine kinase [Candidatus Limiplasma sp.]|nr:sensor histidine kinase [Candidatus Limiplasma sp.]
MSRKPLEGRSLQSVLTASFLACIGVILLFMLAMLMPRVTQLLQQNAIQRTKETLLQSVSSLEIYIDNMVSTLHFASSQTTTQPDEGPQALRQRLSVLQSSRTDVVNIAVFREDGGLYAGTGGSLRVPASQVRQSEWFQKALEWEGTVTYFSSPHVQDLFSDHRSLVITMARRLDYFKDGQRQTGVALLDFDYTAFSSLVDSVSLGQSGYAYLMDESGELICHPRLQLIYQGLCQEDRAAAQSQIVGAAQDQSGGRDRALILATVAQTRWRMAGVAYLDELYALQNTIIRILTVVMADAALLSLAAATLMSYLVTRPITHLEHKMQKVQSGDLNVTIAEKGFREIRSVSQAFNHMLAQIRTLMDRVVQEQETKRLHELNALQAQINPHFLYNTLDSIVWMEERGRSQEAITMVLALAKLFRISISKGRRFITVREELEHVRNYLVIQKMRFKDRFVYTIDAQEEALPERTVKLIVQPLTENCISHAIDEARDGELHIAIRAWVTEKDLFFSVTDDGLGIPPQRLPELLNASGTTGFGLKNVHERIRLTYGPEYGLTIHSVEDEGTTVTIRIPRGWEEDRA